MLATLLRGVSVPECSCTLLQSFPAKPNQNISELQTSANVSTFEGCSSVWVQKLMASRPLSKHGTCRSAKGTYSLAGFQVVWCKFTDVSEVGLLASSGSVCCLFLIRCLLCLIFYPDDGSSVFVGDISMLGVHSSRFVCSLMQCRNS